MELTDCLNLKALSEVEVVTPNNPNQVPMVVSSETTPEPKKRGRKPGSRNNTTTEVVAAAQNTTNLMSTNTPYIDSYSENTDALKGIICQADMVAGEMKTMLDTIVNSKTAKNKFFNASNCASTINSLLSTKLTAIKELNKTTYDCHTLEAKRAQAMKAADQAAANDDKYLQDLYTAFVNTPINQQMPMAAALNVGSSNVIANNQYSALNNVNDGQAGYQQFAQNLTPEQNRMILGDNPNIETVVIYNESTGEARFDVIDTSTGMRVPNFPLPDQCMLEGIKINKITGIASNTNFNESWKLVIEGIPGLNNF